MNRVYLSLGSNLGDTQKNIEEALRLLSERVAVSKVSSFYETEPVGFRDQPWFLNIAAEGETALSPFDLLAFTQSIEKKMKRVKTIVNGPRVIDIDILLYDDVKIETDNLVIPHPRMLERAFVLTPLTEIAPELFVDGQSVASRAETVGGVAVRRRPSP